MADETPPATREHAPEVTDEMVTAARDAAARWGPGHVTYCIPSLDQTRYMLEAALTARPAPPGTDGHPGDVP